MIHHARQSPYQFEASNRWSVVVRDSLAQHAGVPAIPVPQCVARWKNLQRKALRRANAEAEKDLTEARRADERKTCTVKKVQAMHRGNAVRAAMRAAFAAKAAAEAEADRDIDRANTAAAAYKIAHFCDKHHRNYRGRVARRVLARVIEE